MEKIKIIYYKLSLKILRLRNKFYRLTHKNNFTNKVTIVSSLKYKNKEDINLEYALLKNNIDTIIASWDKDTITNNAIIRSVWNYYNNLEQFTNFITNLPKKVINSKEIILNNMNKEKQYKLFTKYNIPHISTTFIKDNKALNNIDIKEPLVIKPTISAAGANTFKINNNKELKIAIKNYQNKGINYIMVQSYQQGIKDGEISIILLNNNIEYGIKRFPGILTNNCSLNYVSKNDIDKEIIDITKKIQNIKEYQNNTFMRIDLIKENNSYKVLELELLDPALFIETIPNKKERQNMYNKFAQIIKEKL